jgi:subtilisin-like proprotein convertase family protein
MRLNIAAILFAILIAVGTQAQTYTTNSYSQAVNTPLLDDNPNGASSTINVSGLFGTIVDLSVSLNMTNGYNGDIYGYLYNSSSGGFAVLLNRVGVQSGDPFGYGDSGFHVLFTLSTNNIHYYQNQSYSLDGSGALLGTWGVDGRDIDPATNSATLGNTDPTALLDSFIGTSPNGAWTMFLADMSGGYQSYWADWQINLVTVPEPSTFAQLLLAGGIGGAIYFSRRQQKQKSQASENS